MKRDSHDSDVESTTTRYCSVCEAPSNGYHFNAPSCSACAAFFRRTVTLDRQFVCMNSQDCVVEFTMRVICRACRYMKCIKAGMDRKAVQPRRDRNLPRRKAQPVKRVLSAEAALDMDFMHNPLMDEGPSSIAGPYSIPLTLNIPSFPNTPQMYEPKESYEDHLGELMRLERLYNERRKILYCARSSISTLLSTCEIDDIPYSSSEIEVLTYAAIQKDLRPQILLTYEWIRSWEHTKNMTLTDRKMFLRRCILYHTILDPAYLTYRLGEKKRFIMFNGLFVGIGRDSNEGWADEAGIISSSLKQELYRPLMERVNNELVEPMRQIGLTYTEYIVLKGIISFNGSALGIHDMAPGIREKMKNQVDMILRSLHRHYAELGYSLHQVAERTGNIVLLMSAVFAVSLECLESHQKIQFFDLWELDDLVLQLLSRRKPPASPKEEHVANWSPSSGSDTVNSVESVNTASPLVRNNLLLSSTAAQPSPITLPFSPAV